MKSLLNIIEGLKIGSKTKIHYKDKSNWSINDAEDGDIVMSDCVLFIYKSLDTEKKFNSFSNAIIYHACCSINNGSIPKEHNLVIGPSIGVGTTKDDNIIYHYRLAPKDLCDEFIELLEKEGYKWDKVKLKLTKI